MAQVDLYQYINEIKTLLGSNRHKAAALHCQHILQNYPRHVETYRLLARSLLARRQYQDAADLYQRILSADPTDLNALTSMAQIYRAQKEYAMAGRYMELAVELDPYNDLLRGRLEELYQKQKQSVPKTGISQAGLGVLHFRSRLYRQAISSLTAVLREQPERLDLSVMLAEAYWRLDRHVEAVKICLQILDKLPHCIKVNAILAEIWLRTDKIAGAQKHLRLVQSLTLPAQNHLDADMPEGRAFLIRDSVNIPKQIAVDYLDNVTGVDESGVYDADDWGDDLGLEDVYLEGDGVKREEVEVDFFSLLESADAEEVFAFDETAEDQFDESRGTGWLNDISQSGRQRALRTTDPSASGEEEAADFSTAAAFEAAEGDMPDWLSEIETRDEATASAEYGQPEEVPTWLSETGELRNPFGADNMPSWLEEATQEQESMDDSSDLFMTDDELAGLWQHDNQMEELTSDRPVDESDEDEFAFLDAGSSGAAESPFSGEPSLMNHLMGSEDSADDDDTFSFLDADDDGTGDGFADWLTATGTNLEAPLSDESEEEPSWLAAEEVDDFSGGREADALFDSGDGEEMDFGDDADWLSELTGEQEPLKSFIDDEDEDLEIFAFSAIDQDDELATAAENEGTSDDDLIDFAFSSTDEFHAELNTDLAADLDNFGQETDDGFGEKTPDWLSEVSNTEQDVSILSHQHTSRLLMPEGEDAPAWLVESSAETDAAAADDEAKELSDGDPEIGTAADLAWLNSLGGEESASESALDDSWLFDDNEGEDQELSDWFSNLEAAAAGSDDTADEPEDRPADAEAALPDWVSSGYSLSTHESEQLGEPPTSLFNEQEGDALDPDWLAEMDVEEAAEEAFDLTPDWMSTSSLEPTVAEPTDETENWLSDFTAATAEEAEEEAGLADDWLAEMPLDKSTDEAEVDDEWLSEMSAEAESAEAKPTDANWLEAMAVDTEPDEFDSSTSDWLSDFTAVDEPEDEEEAGLTADWLSEMKLAPAEREGEAETTQGVTPSDWLSDFPADDEGTAAEDDLASNWLSEIPQETAEDEETADDWLAEMAIDSQLAEGDALPGDWLSDLTAEDKVTESESWLTESDDFTIDELLIEDTDEVTTPDWLAGISSTKEEETPALQATAASQAMETEDDVELLEEAASTDVLSEDTSEVELATEESSEGDLPGWLQGTITEDARTIDTGRLNPTLLSQGFNRKHEEEETPDWLMAADDEDDSGTHPAILSDSSVEELRLNEETAEAAENIPEWLDEVSAEMAHMQSEDEDEELSSWLEDMADISPEEQLSSETWLFDKDRADDPADELGIDDDGAEMLFEVAESLEEKPADVMQDSDTKIEELDEADLLTGPVDWLTGLPVGDASASFEELGDSSDDAFEEDKPVTDWLTGQVVDKEEREFDLAELAPGEDEFAEPLPDWAQENVTDEVDWLAEMEAADSEASLDRVSAEKEVTEVDDFADTLGLLDDDVIDESADGAPDDLTFFDFAIDEDSNWLKLAAAADIEREDDDLVDLADILDEADEAVAVDETAKLPDWFGGMLDELASEDDLMAEPDNFETDFAGIEDEAASEDPVITTMSAADDLSEPGELDWSAEMAPDPRVDEQLNDLAEGMAELAADSYGDEAGEFDDRPLLETASNDDLAEWLTNNEVLTDEFETAADEERQSLGASGEDINTPDWLFDSSLLEDESNKLPDEKQTGNNDLAEPAQKETKSEDLEDVLSWLEAIALKDDES